MSRDIDSDALTLVQKQLGISGIGESATTLESDELVQTFDTGAAVRRSRSDVQTGGLFYGVLLNAHGAGATDEFSVIDPYAAAVDRVNTWPAAVPREFDVWVLGVAARVSGGTGSNFDEGMVTLGLPERMMGWGVNQAGVATGALSVGFALAVYNTLINVDTTNNLLQGADRPPFTKLGLRVPRGAFLRFETEASNAVTVQAIFSLGLFPVGMGQDGIG